MLIGVVTVAKLIPNSTLRLSVQPSFAAFSVRFHPFSNVEETSKICHTIALASAATA